jgi:hypothetical protein
MLTIYCFYNRLRVVIKSSLKRWRPSWFSPKLQLFYNHNLIIIQEKLLDLIPSSIPLKYKLNDKNFIRDRKLPLPKLIAFILHLSSCNRKDGIDIRSAEFFKNARRSDLWPDAEAVHRSSVTKARKKVSWQLFQDIYYHSVELAHNFFPNLDKYKWHGMSIYAIDGSKYTLPASNELREKFDHKSGLENSGKGHYPQCLISTVYDVFRRLPIAKTVVACDSSERTEAIKMLPKIPSNNLILFDRGYPGYDFIKEIIRNYSGYFLFRCPAKGSFSALKEFVESNKTDTIILITPSINHPKTNSSESDCHTMIKLRAIKLLNPDGELSILLTNLFNDKIYSETSLKSLYYKRWGVEVHYRDDKETAEIEEFHSKSSNGILQEIFASAIMNVISRILITIAMDPMKEEKSEPQFKNALKAISNEVALLVSKNPDKVAVYFKELLIEISRVRYYKSVKERSSQPRVCKKPINKWATTKIRRLAMA